MSNSFPPPRAGHCLAQCLSQALRHLQAQCPALALCPLLTVGPALTLCIVAAWTTTHSPTTHALDSRSCFAHAETYYETLYCEINAQAPGVALPDFWDFKKNNEVMQALLIKKPARKIYIEVARPVTRKQTVRTASALAPAAPGRSDCALQGNQLYCGGAVYRALGNTANGKLDAGVWNETFKLSLPRFDGDHQNNLQVQDYLKTSYARYLQRMLAIGLAGETFSFNKFAFFFADHHAKGVDFSERFEKMFYFLKQDKQQIAVNTAINIPQDMDTRYCETFSNLLACAQQRSNYLFRRVASQP